MSLTVEDQQFLEELRVEAGTYRQPEPTWYEQLVYYGDTERREPRPDLELARWRFMQAEIAVYGSVEEAERTRREAQRRLRRAEAARRARKIKAQLDGGWVNGGFVR